MAIGKRLNNILKQKNMKVTNLASISDVPASTIYSIIKRDGKRLDSQTLERISSALEISENYLLTGHELFNPFFLISTMNEKNINEEELIIETGCDPKVFKGVLPSKTIRKRISEYLGKPESLIFLSSIEKSSLEQYIEILEINKHWNSEKNCKKLIDIYNQCEKTEQKKIVEYAQDIYKANCKTR